MLFKIEVDFIIESFQCQEESGEYEVTAYVVCTESVDGAILPDMSKGTVAFLVYNQNLADHMKEEGFTDEEIEKNGKVWTIIENAEDFVKILTS
jgi:hypothetical protein